MIALMITTKVEVRRKQLEIICAKVKNNFPFKKKRERYGVYESRGLWCTSFS